MTPPCTAFGQKLLFSVGFVVNKKERMSIFFKASYPLSGKKIKSACHSNRFKITTMDAPEPMKPARLTQSYRGRFPFSLGTTSFIYRDTWAANARRLAPYLDEIELLLFESRPPTSLPTPGQIEALADIAQERQIRYNIHLPTDIDLGHPQGEKRRVAVNTLVQVLTLTAPLGATTHTLHLNLNQTEPTARELVKWQQTVSDSLGRLLATGLDGRRLSIETLFYPVGWITPIVRDLGLSFCLDLGHLMLQGLDCGAIFDQLGDRTTVIHLHGVKGGRDHLPLDQLSDDKMHAVLKVLQQFTATVSLEVFSFHDLQRSLNHLDSVRGPLHQQ
jgi:sugar phosphate isomerase/epimerase